MIDASLWEEPGVHHLFAISWVILIAFLHLHLRNPNICDLLRRLWTWLQPSMSQRQLDQQRRYEEEFQKTRIQNFMHANTLFIHLTFGLCLANFWRVVWTPTIGLVSQQLSMLLQHTACIAGQMGESPRVVSFAFGQRSLLPSFHECAHHIQRDGSINTLPFGQNAWMHPGNLEYSLQ